MQHITLSNCNKLSDPYEIRAVWRCSKVQEDFAMGEYDLPKMYIVLNVSPAGSIVKCDIHLQRNICLKPWPLISNF